MRPIGKLMFLCVFAMTLTNAASRADDASDPAKPPVAKPADPVTPGVITPDTDEGKQGSDDLVSADDAPKTPGTRKRIVQVGISREEPGAGEPGQLILNGGFGFKFRAKDGTVGNALSIDFEIMQPSRNDDGKRDYFHNVSFTVTSWEKELKKHPGTSVSLGRVKFARDIGAGLLSDAEFNTIAITKNLSFFDGAKLLRRLGMSVEAAGTAEGLGVRTIQVEGEKRLWGPTLVAGEAELNVVKEFKGLEFSGGPTFSGDSSAGFGRDGSPVYGNTTYGLGANVVKNFEKGKIIFSVSKEFTSWHGVGVPGEKPLFFSVTFLASAESKSKFRHLKHKVYR